MFRWYRDAVECLAYLTDVPSSDNAGESGSSFRKSRWFKRGWTLQELIAPRDVCFLNREWTKIGHRARLNGILKQITGIESMYITGGSGNIHMALAATKMSWMKGRSTTRKEDMAYCLLGIFNISMPMLYGEGDRAFMRLQEEIMRVSDDSSLLAWGYTGSMVQSWGRSLSYGFYLAASPELFSNCRDFAECEFHGALERPTYAVTQRGLQIHLPVIVDPQHPALAYGALGCLVSRQGNNLCLAVPLLNAGIIRPEHFRHHDFVRSNIASVQEISEELLQKGIMLDICILRRSGEECIGPGGAYLGSLLADLNYTVENAYPPQLIEYTTNALLLKIDLEEHFKHTGNSSRNQLHSFRRPDTYVNIFYLRRGDLGFLLFYEYEIHHRPPLPPELRPHAERGCRFYQFPGEFSLEYAMKLASDAKMHKELEPAKLTNSHGSELFRADSYLLQFYPTEEDIDQLSRHHTSGSD